MRSIRNRLTVITISDESRIADSATVENAEIGANVHVAAGAEIVDSTLERTVVFPDATIRDCELRGSIIDRDTHLENLDLAGALIGTHEDCQREVILSAIRSCRY